MSEQQPTAAASLAGALQILFSNVVQIVALNRQFLTDLRDCLLVTRVDAALKKERDLAKLLVAQHAHLDRTDKCSEVLLTYAPFFKVGRWLRAVNPIPGCTCVLEPRVRKLAPRAAERWLLRLRAPCQTILIDCRRELPCRSTSATPITTRGP